jgi:thiol-disulfide isomerase/thioredoxin
VVAALLAVAGTSCQVEVPGIGQPLGDLDLVPLTQRSRSLTAADLRGKVTVLNFWGTWCPPCRQEFPDLVEIWKQYRDRSEFQLLAVSCGAGQREDLAALTQETLEFLKYEGVPDFPAFSDPEQRTRQAVDAVAGFTGYPTTLLLDQQGQIVRIWVGYDPAMQADLTASIERLLAAARPMAAR